jgi:hypothetical protein
MANENVFVTCTFPKKEPSCKNLPIHSIHQDRRWFWWAMQDAACTF